MTKFELIKEASSILEKHIEDEKLRETLLNNVKEFAGSFSKDLYIEMATAIWSSEDNCLRFFWNLKEPYVIEGEFDFCVDGGHAWYIHTSHTEFGFGSVDGYFNYYDDFIDLLEDEDEELADLL